MAVVRILLYVFATGLFLHAVAKIVKARRFPADNALDILGIIVTILLAIVIQPSQPSSPPPPTSTPPSTSTFPTTTALAVTTAPIGDLPAEIILPMGAHMKLIPAGEFHLGSNTMVDEEPPQTITLDAFYMDETEVTNAFYKFCVDAGKCQPPRDIKSNTRSNYYGNPEFDHYPVIYVDWKMAKVYCEWLGARLPTEAEWEKAARGMDGRTYPWGEEIDCEHANYGRDTSKVCTGDTTIVGAYEIGQSMYGLYDMAGNVNEWVSSLYRPYPYHADDGRENLNALNVRVFRGGSWDYTTGDVRASNRNGFRPDTANQTIGFRCARDP